MFILGLYYRDKKMKNYYLLAINKGCIKSMNNLATYYYKKKYKKMKKYFYMIMNYNDIIKTGYYKHILYLKLYYDNKRKFKKMKQILLKSGNIEKSCINSMIYLGNYYNNINNFDKMKIYCLMAIFKIEKNDDIYIYKPLNILLSAYKNIIFDNKYCTINTIFDIYIYYIFQRYIIYNYIYLFYLSY